MRRGDAAGLALERGVGGKRRRFRVEGRELAGEGRPIGEICILQYALPLIARRSVLGRRDGFGIVEPKVEGALARHRRLCEIGGHLQGGRLADIPAQSEVKAAGRWALREREQTRRFGPERGVAGGDGDVHLQLIAHPQVGHVQDRR